MMRQAPHSTPHFAEGTRGGERCEKGTLTVRCIKFITDVAYENVCGILIHLCGNKILKFGRITSSVHLSESHCRLTVHFPLADMQTRDARRTRKEWRKEKKIWGNWNIGSAESGPLTSTRSRFDRRKIKLLLSWRFWKVCAHRWLNEESCLKLGVYVCIIWSHGLPPVCLWIWISLKRHKMVVSILFWFLFVLQLISNGVRMSSFSTLLWRI